MLAAQLAAELSACRWCIERGRHDWRSARLPPILLRRSPSSKRRAGAATVRTPSPNPSLAEVRRLFSEAEIAELARCLADHHFLDDSIP
jgi:hypothetical protein